MATEVFPGEKVCTHELQDSVVLDAFSELRRVPLRLVDRRVSKDKSKNSDNVVPLTIRNLQEVD